MDDDQQYCLRWNNHQSTLISVFDTLLESETLVDCTLAAEGKILKAHKVVLSACSPYFATLLLEQYDKHPVFILKDVKYQELRAMMDYMYRGEVNISQDQLSALLRAAESLQIKGLSDNRTPSAAAPPPAKPEPQQQQQQQHRGKLCTDYTLEQTKRARMGMDAAPVVTGSREGSSSPSRRRRKVRRRSMENDAHDNSNSSMLQVAAASNQSILQQTNAAAALVATQLPIIGGGTTIATNKGTIQQQQPLTTTTNVTKKTESAKGTSTSLLSTVAAAAASVQQPTTSDAMNTENVQIASSIGQGSGAVIIGVDEQVAGSDHKSNHKQQKLLSKEASTSSAAAAAAAAAGELVIEPKSEYDDEGHEETVEDLTLDDEEMGMEELDQTAGTSQGGEGSSQGYAAWQHDRSQEELLLATQDAQQRDPQDFTKTAFRTNQDMNVNGSAAGTENDIETPERPPSVEERFPCPVCDKSYLRKRHLQRHMRDECIDIPPRFNCELCPSRFRRKYHMVRHLISKHNIPADIAQQASGNGSRTSSQSSNISIAALAAAAGVAVTGVVPNSEPPMTAHDIFGIKQEMNVGVGGTTALAALSAVAAAAAAANCFNGGGSSSCASGDNISIASTSSLNGCNSPLPENLSMRKNRYNNENLPTSPLDANSCISPLPPNMIPMPTYGLTGAITAISAAAAVVEEQAAAVAAAAGSKKKTTKKGKKKTGAVGGVSTTMLEGQFNGANGNGNGMNIKTEPGTTPTPPTNGQQNVMDDEWKMKLGMQIISNSLLKERLMNTMPYAFNNN